MIINYNLKLKNPFVNQSFTCDTTYELNGDILIISTKEGQEIKFEISTYLLSLRRGSFALTR